ncbi:hypothetical protein MSPP1_000994 [Malassezia sp. CBS 17886]|nr:hypothetical protein MSPP1_000994 [Malassezia sp. CBS 17886]
MITQDASGKTAIDFSDLPFRATSKYLIQHELGPGYPARALLQDPRTEHLTDQDVTQTDPVVEAADDEMRHQSGVMRTRHAQAERRADARSETETVFFDPNDAHDRLSAIATEHYAATPPPKESDAIVGFLYRCRANDSVLKVI